MTALAVTVLMSSLAGSLHCAGMCGGLAAMAAAGDGRGSRLAALSAYNGGRLLVYAVLGGAAGLVGHTLDVAGALVGVRRAASVAAGAAILAWGVAMLARRLGTPGPRRWPRLATGALVARALARVGGGSRSRRAFAVGVVTGLLPCGWLWAFVAAAGGTGGWASGALLMAVFWLGTLPLMAGLGAGVGAAVGPLRRHAPLVSALALIAMGLAAVAGGLAGGAPASVFPAALGHAASERGGAHDHR